VQNQPTTQMTLAVILGHVAESAVMAEWRNRHSVTLTLGAHAAEVTLGVFPPATPRGALSAIHRRKELESLANELATHGLSVEMRGTVNTRLSDASPVTVRIWPA
jgi:hypothetical protein